MDEEWRVIAEFPWYAVSSQGRVKGLCAQNRHPANRILKPAVSRCGYLTVGLYKGDRRLPYRRAIHRLVAIAFLGEPPSTKHHVAHWDSVRTNNHVSNLRWATPAENNADKIRHGTHQIGERSPVVKLNEKIVAEIKTRFRSGERLASIGRAFGLSRGHAGHICRGRIWAHVNV